MSTGRERLLADARSQLGRVITETPGLDLADRSFAAWLLGTVECPFDIPATVAAGIEQRSRGYREVAALGFAAELASPACAFRAELCVELARLSKRPMTMCGEAAGFVSDPVALLGIALGASCCGDPGIEADITSWMERVFAARHALPGFEPWEACLASAAVFRLRRPALAATSDSPSTADCRIALRARGVMQQSRPAVESADEANLVTILIGEPHDTPSYTRAVIRAAAFDALKRETLAAGKLGAVNMPAIDTGTDASGSKSRKVFVSYSWDESDPGHQPRVLAFTNQLRQYGFAATIDLFEPNPPEGLPQWMVNQIRRSDFVLMVITETYRRRFEGDEDAGKGKGVKWEGGIVTRSIYQTEFHNRKFIPVVFGSTHIPFVPTILVGNTYFDVTKPERLEDLVRLMSDQPAYIPVPIGQVPHLPPRPGN